MVSDVASRRKHLEAYFQKYPDVPREVVVKEDILREGVRFTEAALEKGKQSQPKSYHLFSFDKATPKEMEHQETLRAPECLEISGGPYGLRGLTMVRVRLNPASPYLVDVSDGWVGLYADGALLADIDRYPPVPKFYSKTFPDGTPYSQVVQLLWGNRGYPRVITPMACQYWGPKEECLYCDINQNIRLRKERKALTMTRQYQKVDQVAEVVKEIILGEEWYQGKRPNFVMISGGSIFRKFMGKTEEEFFIEYVKALRWCCGSDWPMDSDLQTTPVEKPVAQRMYDAGVRVHRCNYEVWDKDLFNIICPGKTKYLGRDEWIRRTVEQVETFGVGKVYPGFVAGVEMAQPWGFKTVDEAIASNREGFEFLMSHGVIPRVINWVPEPLSALGGHEPPSLDYAIKIDLLWYEIWKKYNLPPPPQGEDGQMGPGRARNPNSAFTDVGD